MKELLKLTMEIINLDDITRNIRSAKDELMTCCNGIADELFFHQPVEKWSIAQNVRHLVISHNKTRMAYMLPKFILGWVIGKANRKSKTYEELVNKYEMKLQQGGRASGPFIPENIPGNYGKVKILNEFAKSTSRLENSIEKKWTDPQLDKFIAPHPLLGKITMRELGFFTIHHIHHHLRIIRDRL